MQLVFQPNLVQESEETLSCPDGGFKLATVSLIVAVWFAFRKGLLSLNALRAWAALHEVAARRAAHYFTERKQGRKTRLTPHYRLAEIAHLMGLPVKVAKKAVAELV